MILYPMTQPQPLNSYEPLSPGPWTPTDPEPLAPGPEP